MSKKRYSDDINGISSNVYKNLPRFPLCHAENEFQKGMKREVTQASLSGEFYQEHIIASMNPNIKMVCAEIDSDIYEDNCLTKNIPPNTSYFHMDFDTLITRDCDFHFHEESGFGGVEYQRPLNETQILSIIEGYKNNGEIPKKKMFDIVYFDYCNPLYEARTIATIVFAALCQQIQGGGLIAGTFATNWRGGGDIPFNVNRLYSIAKQSYGISIPKTKRTNIEKGSSYVAQSIINIFQLIFNKLGIEAKCKMKMVYNGSGKATHMFTFMFEIATNHVTSNIDVNYTEIIASRKKAIQNKMQLDPYRKIMNPCKKNSSVNSLIQSALDSGIEGKLKRHYANKIRRKPSSKSQYKACLTMQLKAAKNGEETKII